MYTLYPWRSAVNCEKVSRINLTLIKVTIIFPFSRYKVKTFLIDKVNNITNQKMEEENIYAIPRPRCTPALLSSYTGQSVTVLGTVDSATISSDGRSFALQAGDSGKMTVQLATPLNEMLEGLVEVTGKVDQSCNVHCVVYRMLHQPDNIPFNFEDYHATVEIIHKNPSLLRHK